MAVKGNKERSNNLLTDSEVQVSPALNSEKRAVVKRLRGPSRRTPFSVPFKFNNQEYLYTPYYES